MAFLVMTNTIISAMLKSYFSWVLFLVDSKLPLLHGEIQYRKGKVCKTFFRENDVTGFKLKRFSDWKKYSKAYAGLGSQTRKLMLMK